MNDVEAGHTVFSNDGTLYLVSVVGVDEVDGKV